MAASLKLTGDKALIKALDAIGGRVNAKVIKPAASAAMVPVNKAAKRTLRANKRTGQLWRSIGKKTVQYKRTGVTWVGVGPRTGFDIDTEEFGRVDPVKYGHLVEFGTEHSAAQPYLRPALDSNRGRIEAILSRKLWAGIRREAERLAKKG